MAEVRDLLADKKFHSASSYILNESFLSFAFLEYSFASSGLNTAFLFGGITAQDNIVSGATCCIGIKLNVK